MRIVSTILARLLSVISKINKIRYRNFIIIFSILFAQNTFGQESQFIHQVDSLYDYRHTDELCDLIQKELYQEKKYPQQELYLLEKLVNAYLLKEDFANAKIYWYKLNTKTGEAVTKDKARITFMKSGIHYFENNIDSAYIAVTEAKDMFVELKDTISIINCLGNIGAVHFNKTEYEKGLNYIKDAIKLAEAKKLIFFELYLNTATAYKKLKRTDLELDAHYHVLKAAKVEPVDFNNLVQSYYNIAEFKNRTRNYIHSQELLDSCELYINNNTKPILQTDFLNLRVSNFQGLGQTDSISSLFLRRETIVKEKLLNYYTAGISEIQDNHQKQIKLAIQHQKIKNEENHLIQKFLILMLALSSILAFIYNKYLQSKKNKLEAKIEKEQTELNLSLAQINPNFILYSISKIQDTLREEKNKPAANHLSKLSKLMRQTLENSRVQFHELEVEISSLKEYLALKKLQTPFEFELDLDFKGDLSELYVPPMIIQAFIERIFEINNDIPESDIFKLDIQLNDENKYLNCNIQPSLNGNDILLIEKEFLASDTIESIVKKIHSLINDSTNESDINTASILNPKRSQIALRIPFKIFEI